MRTRRKRTRKHSKKQRGAGQSGRRLILKMSPDEGLGNQLFTLAMGIRAQKLTNLPLYIILNNSKYHTKKSYKDLYENHERNVFILEGDNANILIEHAKPILDKKTDSVIAKVEESHFIWNPDDSGDVKIPEHLYQNYEGVQSVISDVKSLLLQNEFENETKKSMYDSLRSETDSEHSAFMHIRLGDYKKSGWAQNVDFFIEALKELEKNPLIKFVYVICTDDNFYKENESKLKGATTKEVRLYNNPDEVAAMYKMILCRAGAILSASTFSAWGAMMGADMNDKSTIIYPKQWIKHIKWGDNPLMFPKRWIPVNSTAIEGQYGYSWRNDAEAAKKGGMRTRGNRQKYTRRKRGGQMNVTTPKFSFISYGNENFVQSRERIRKEAEQMGCFDGQIKVYTPEDFSEEFKKAVGGILNEPKGGGYWTWKPYIIADMLSKLNENDILVYADAGCTLQPAGVPRLKEYAEMISPKSNKAVLAMRLLDGTKYGPGGFLLKKWSSTSVFKYFNQPLDGKIAISNQILAGVIICRKCKESAEVIGRFLEVAMKRPDLFTDRYNLESKLSNPAFKNNRHDQPIWSMIVQLEPYNKYCAIIDEEIEINHGTPSTDNIRKSSPIIATRHKL
jgi:hypothetical protein